MNLFGIIEEIEKVDPEFNEKISPRRAAIKNMTGFGAKVAVAALPFALGSMFKKAYAGASTASVVGVLNFALTLEFFEAKFYSVALSQTGLVTDTAYINQIGTDESNHVIFLTSVIKSLGGTPVTPNQNYDFTAGGTFPTVMSDYATFLAVAGVIEDTGVRAYKGQAGNLLGNQTVLTAALGIHAVEARHAAAIRYLRSTKGATIDPWINSTTANSNDTGISAADGNYAGMTPENTTMQGGVDITKLASVESSSSTSFTVAAAAFDEPLGTQEVLKLVAPFGVS